MSLEETCEQLARGYAENGCVDLTDKYLKRAEEMGHYIPEEERMAIYKESRIKGVRRHLKSAEEHANCSFGPSSGCASVCLNNARKCVEDIRKVGTGPEYKILLKEIENTEKTIENLLK